MQTEERKLLWDVSVLAKTILLCIVSLVAASAQRDNMRKREVIILYVDQTVCTHKYHIVVSLDRFYL